MDKLNPQADELNKTIKDSNPIVFELLSDKGRKIFFPKKGILAQGAEAKGKEINATLGMAVGDDGKPLVLSITKENINLDSADAFYYAPSYGKKELRDEWKDQLYQKNPSLEGKEISLPVVTNAITHGLSVLGYMFIDEGDEIILPDLYWGNYRLVFSHGFDARLNTFRFFKGDGIDIDAFRNKMSEGKIGKKIVLLNFPNNPSGYTPTEDEAKTLISILKESAEAGNKIIAVMDDAYFGLVFREGIHKESLFAALADLHENLLAIKVDGITKEDYSWGLRVGFVTYGIKNGSKELYTALEAKTAGTVRGNISNCCHLSQSLALKSFNSPERYREEKDKTNHLLHTRFEIVDKILADHDEYKEYFEALPFNSGYFMCIRLKTADAEDVRKVLLDKYSTGLIAIGDLLRIAYSATPTDKLRKVFQNIYMACKDCTTGK